ncbi:MAG: Crp/Fnr family transcriptional regulator [Alphaproteobacteria bacterium]|nr:Crp/Fnr family transcriptional regulator [Alphaproteobacteria bacterium]
MEACLSTSRLKVVTLLDGLTDSELTEIEQLCHWHQLGADSIVFDKESDTLEVYFLIEGSVRVLSYSPYAREKREVTLANFVAGEYFGELAALDGKPRSAKVVTSEPSILASLEGPAFREAMIRFPKLALRVTLRLADIIRRLDSRVTELSTLSEPERVFTELLHLAKPDSKKPGQYLISEMPKHKDLASWTGTSTEIVAQVVGELAREGILERRHLGMVVRDYERLRLMARAR